MKNTNINSRTFIILGVLALCIWSILPTFYVHSQPAESKAEYIRNNPKEANKAINFGLDLAGGCHVVVEMDTSAVPAEERSKALALSLEIIRNRVDKFGLSEPQIASSGETRIVADLAGLTSDQCKEIIGSTAKLEFKLVLDPARLSPVLNRIDEFLKKKSSLTEELVSKNGVVASEAPATDAAALIGETDYDKIAGTDSLLADSTQKDSTTLAQKDSAGADTTLPQEDLETFKQRGFSGLFVRWGNRDLAIPEENVEKARKILEDEQVRALVPFDMQLAFGRGFEVLANGNKVKLFYALKKRPEMTGEDIRDAQPLRAAGGMSAGEIAVNMTFGGIGPKLFAQVTGNNVGNQLAIVLDNQVVSAPVIRAKIPGGNAQITGLADYAEAKQLAVVLRAGALPAPMNMVELRSVGATLGQENINSGVKAALFGLALVIVFMMVYYMGAGVKSVVALVFNMIMIVAIMSMFNATLTLPGIAGIILTIGMAVDSNVIIFERIREEIRAGRSPRSSVNAGFEKAFSTIIDANITTFLTAFILFKIGSGPIKGFGLTLMIGIIATLFSTLYVTRYFFLLTASKDDQSKVSIGGGIKSLNEPKYPIMSVRKAFVGVSVAFVLVSAGLLAVKGLNYGVDFTGGHLVTVDINGDVSNSQVEQALTNVGFEHTKVVTISGPEGNHFLISLDDKGKSDVRPELEKGLASLGSTYDILNEDVVGPSIGKELKADAMWAIFWSLLIIIIYIKVRFGKMGLGFGLGSVVTLMHDVIITLGIFSLMGMAIDAAFVAAILTIVGYSLNDTIVVFDRIRENSQSGIGGSYENLVNESINQSLSRTFMTSLTTLFVTVILWIFGGIAIKDFALAMTIGIVVGTYSSVFVASPFVVWWANRHGVKSN